MSKQKRRANKRIDKRIELTARSPPPSRPVRWGILPSRFEATVVSSAAAAASSETGDAGARPSVASSAAICFFSRCRTLRRFFPPFSGRSSFARR
jgi:hypothetical protein